MATAGVLVLLLALVGNALAQTTAPPTPIKVHRGNLAVDVDPEIEVVRSTPRGYVVVGRGFASDAGKVKIFENGVPVQETAIMGASATRISVFSVPTGRTGVSVQVGNKRSPSAYFTHVEPRAPDDDQLADNSSDSTFNSPGLISSGSTASGSFAQGQQPRSRVLPLPAGRKQLTNSVRTPAKSDGYLAREVLRLRDRLEMLEEELLLIRSQLGITSR